jgi:hypothetical protein
LLFSRRIPRVRCGLGGAASRLHDDTHFLEIEILNRKTLEVLDGLGCLSGASKEDISRVMDWQFPMYPLELTEIRVTEDAIQRERDAAFDYYV